jgi:hypothetical protein
MNYLIPNQLFNQPGDVKTPNKTIRQMAKKLHLMLVLICCASFANAQATLGETTPTVRKLSVFLNEVRAADLNSNSTYSRADHVNALLYKVQPSLYYNGTATAYGAKPTSLFTDVSQLGSLNAASMEKNNVEIATVYINTAAQLGSTIDLQNFSSFKKLKYVHIVSKVPVTEKKINDMVLHPQERLSVFYEITSGDTNQ